MSKIKTAHIVHSVGGVDVSVRLITENIDAHNFDTLVIHGLTDSKIPFKNNLGEEIRDYKLPINREISPLHDLKSIYKTVKILKKERPDIVHAHSAKGGVIARVASLFYRTTVLHTPQAYSFLSEPKGFKRKLFVFIEKVLKRFNSILVASSNSERDRGIIEVGYKKERTVLFNNSIKPINKNSLVPAEIILPKDFICTVGRPSYQKNIELMVEVIRTLKEKQPDVYLVILGVGEYSPNKEIVENMIRKYQLEENIMLIPWIDRAQIFSIIDKAKLYVSTARYEGLPYSIIESLALGKSCVVTNSDGNRDLVKDGYNGYVIEENSVDRMANCIFALLNDEGLRTSYEQNSLDFFNENFNIENNIENLEKIYIRYSKK